MNVKNLIYPIKLLNQTMSFKVCVYQYKYFKEYMR